jgi:hypothetical protein
MAGVLSNQFNGANAILDEQSSANLGAAPTVTGVTVSPSTATVAGGDAQVFTATVAGTNSPSQAVTWSIVAGGGSINAAGVFFAPGATGSAQTITVKATSVLDGNYNGTATVTVPAAAPHVVPGNVSSAKSSRSRRKGRR